MALVLSSMSLAIAAPNPQTETATPAAQDVGYLGVYVRAGLQGDNHPIQGAKVTVLETNTKVETGADGLTPPIALPAHKPGSTEPQTYSIRVQAAGFREYELTDLLTSPDGPLEAFVFLTKGSGKETHANSRKWQRTEAPRKEAQPMEAVQPLSAQALMAPGLTQPYQLQVCEHDVQKGQPMCADSEYTFIPINQLIVETSYKELGNLDSVYNSSTWTLAALEANDVAIRSWLLRWDFLYNRTNYDGTPQIHAGVPYVYNSQKDLAWAFQCPSTTTSVCQKYANAQLYTTGEYMAWGTTSDGYAAPIDAEFCSLVGNPSSNMSVNGQYPYLAAHPEESDASHNYGPDICPGLSQRGSNDWVKGFTYNGTFYQITDYHSLLRHFYDYYGTGAFDGFAIGN